MSALGGIAEVAIGGITIPASMLSEVAIDLTEGTRSRDTLAGTFTSPSGTLETATVTFTIYLPSIDYLKDIFPSRYNAPSAPQLTGNLIWDTQACGLQDSSPVNIHYTCEPNDNNDMFIYNGRLQMNFSPTLNATDDLMLEVIVHAQPDENGRVYRLGTGDLTAVSIFDPETQTTVPVDES